MVVSANAANNMMVLHHQPADEDVDENDFGTCHLCGHHRKLTKEHVPPRAAFNSSPRLWQAMARRGEGVGSLPVRVNSGFWVRALCSKCNGESPHAKAYVRFAKSLAEKPRIFDVAGHRRLIYIEEDTHLLAKEIAVMILAAEPVKFGVRHEALRRFVIEDRSLFEPEFQVFAFLVPNSPESGTVVRCHMRIDGSGEGYGFMGGEISFFPFGFIYVWEIGRGYDAGGLTNITHWFNRANRRGTHESFDTRLTVIDSVQAIFGGRGGSPQVDYFT